MIYKCFGFTSSPYITYAAQDEASFTEALHGVCSFALMAEGPSSGHRLHGGLGGTVSLFQITDVWIVIQRHFINTPA